MHTHQQTELEQGLGKNRLNRVNARLGRTDVHLSSYGLDDEALTTLLAQAWRTGGHRSPLEAELEAVEAPALSFF